MTLLLFQPPADNERGPSYLEGLIAGWVANASDLLGSLLVTSLQLAAMSRANVPERDRRDFSIVIDEFQNYATPAIATFLSEARKYRTHLILSHQFTTQLPPEILTAVLGNVGSMIVFQIGADDAELFERQLGGHVTVDNLMNIPKYHAYCRLLINGMPSRLRRTALVSALQREPNSWPSMVGLGCCCHVADGDTITVLDAESRTTPQRADSPKQSTERQS